MILFIIKLILTSIFFTFFRYKLYRKIYPNDGENEPLIDQVKRFI